MVDAMADVIRIKLVRSPIGTTERVRETLRGLGLTRLGRERELARTPMVEGMLRRVAHLVVELKPDSGAGGR
jgi:large subunit ribosomal protein L30